MDDFVVVKTRCGKLRGSVLRSFEGYNYCAFKGVPYAKPPVGDLRFCDPLPAEPWQGIKDATNYGQQCIQIDFVDRSIQGSEDCLYLNIYVKSINNNAQLPVMVWIHGGAFLHGSGDDLFYGPDYLLKKDIVLVTFNYRLGVLGFLNFENEVASGNQGLKDQIMVLRWVQENIKNFGGDPNNVTIFGESAGGASVHYLALSDLTKGLFHKAIAQSGVVCNTWACLSNKDSAYKFCKALGNNSTNVNELIKFLREIDCDILVKLQNKISSEDRLRCTYPFCPGIDSKSKEPVMPIHPLVAIEKGVHVPFILGHNDRDGIYSLAGMKPSHFRELNINFQYYLNPICIDMLKKCNITANDLKRHYFAREEFFENKGKFVDYWTDVHFVDGIHRTLKAQVDNSSAPTYFYRFTYDKDFSITKAVGNNITITGASHFDEVQYLFSMRVYDIFDIERPKKGTAAYKIIEQMTEMWVNFAKFGRPTPVISDLVPTYWLPVTDENLFRALNIDEEIQMEHVLNLHKRLSVLKYVKGKL